MSDNQDIVSTDLPLNILYIDDNENDLHLMGLFLQIHNPEPVRLTCVDNINDARYSLSRNEYDYFILDNIMPEVENFHETLKVLDAPSIKAKIIVVSSDISDSIFREIDELPRKPDSIIEKNNIKQCIIDGLFLRDGSVDKSAEYENDDIKSRHLRSRSKHELLGKTIAAEERRIMKIQTNATIALQKAMQIVKIQ